MCGVNREEVVGLKIWPPKSSDVIQMWYFSRSFKNIWQTNPWAIVLDDTHTTSHTPYNQPLIFSRTTTTTCCEVQSLLVTLAMMMMMIVAASLSKVSFMVLPQRLKIVIFGCNTCAVCLLYDEFTTTSPIYIYWSMKILYTSIYAPAALTFIHLAVILTVIVKLIRKRNK